MGDTLGICNALLNCLPLVILFFVFNINRNNKSTILSILIRSTFYIYTYYLFKYTIFYIPFFDYFKLKIIYSFKDIPFYINLIPFKTILGNVTLYQIIGNLFLLLPLGIYLPLINSKYKIIKSGILIGFVTTLFIEVTQLIVSMTHALYSDYPYTRGADIDDLILNMSGYILGYLISLLLIEGKINNRLQRSIKS
ncbi:VanZ family protein [Peribacillus frigoritolerans]|uniref:VanZ family protein n=1 Tax=Peribacillus frigoritolerans TaxID=450367 RepID=UPI00380B052A